MGTEKCYVRTRPFDQQTCDYECTGSSSPTARPHSLERAGCASSGRRTGEEYTGDRSFILTGRANQVTGFANTAVGLVDRLNSTGCPHVSTIQTSMATDVIRHRRHSATCMVHSSPADQVGPKWPAMLANPSGQPKLARRGMGERTLPCNTALDECTGVTGLKHAFAEALPIK